MHLFILQCLQSVDIDFGKEGTLRAVQSFLHDTNRQFAFKLFGYAHEASPQEWMLTFVCCLFDRRNSDVCAICLDPWTGNGKDPVKLPCGHIYCCSCIKQQFDRQRICPTCKRDVPRRFGCKSDDQLKCDHNHFL